MAAILHDGTEWTEARGFAALATLTPPTDHTTGSAAHYGPGQADSRRSEVEALERRGMDRARAVWVALTDEVAVRGTLSTLGEARAFVEALGLHANGFGFREARAVGHEQGQHYVDTGSCGCLLCVLFPLSPDEGDRDLTDEELDALGGTVTNDHKARGTGRPVRLSDLTGEEYERLADWGAAREECPSCGDLAPSLARYVPGDLNADRVCRACGEEWVRTHFWDDGRGEWVEVEVDPALTYDEAEAIGLDGTGRDQRWPAIVRRSHVEAHDRGVVATVEELLRADLIVAEGAYSILKTVALQPDGDVVSDFAIDVSATIGHVGSGQPDWAYRAYRARVGDVAPDDDETFAAHTHPGEWQTPRVDGCPVCDAHTQGVLDALGELVGSDILAAEDAVDIAIAQGLTVHMAHTLDEEE